MAKLDDIFSAKLDGAAAISAFDRPEAKKVSHASFRQSGAFC